MVTKEYRYVIDFIGRVLGRCKFGEGWSPPTGIIITMAMQANAFFEDGGSKLIY